MGNNQEKDHPGELRYQLGSDEGRKKERGEEP